MLKISLPPARSDENTILPALAPLAAGRAPAEPVSAAPSTAAQTVSDAAISAEDRRGTGRLVSIKAPSDGHTLGVCCSDILRTGVLARLASRSGLPRAYYARTVLFLIALFLAVFVLPQPWGLVVVTVAALVEIAEGFAFMWWSKRGRVRVGVETLVGRSGVAVSALWPEGQVKVDGEVWRARCAGGCDTGDRVVVTAVDGLTLVVVPE
jgi:membrane protein implicated in regulation of membrane protease activity